MNSITDLSPQQLNRAADIKEEIDSLQRQLDEILGAPAEILPAAGGRRKRRLSAQGLANIRAGVRKRLGRRLNRYAAPTLKRRRHMSEEQKARLSAIAKARWKKARAQGKTTL